MFIIKFTDILLTKGDTAIWKVSIQGRDLLETDRITLTVRDNEKNIVFTKEAEGNIFYIAASESEAISAGRYMYDIKLFSAIGEEYTLIHPSKFVIVEGVSND